jgi:polysaccharide pyruvyl transferase CsaB
VKRIFVSGYFGFGNAGDEVILSAVIQQMAAVAVPADITVMSGDPADTARSHGVNALLWSDTAGMESAIAECDLVIIGGGGLFHDYHGFDPNNCLLENQWGISYYTAPAVLGALHAKPVMLYGVGIGPLFSEHGRCMTRLVCALSGAITVRDGHSARLLTEIGVDPRRVTLTDDPVFSRDPGPSLPNRKPGGPPVLGVSVRNWDVGVAPSFWERELGEALDLFIGRTGGSVVFYPFQRHAGSREDDAAASERVRLYMQRRDSTSVAAGGLSATEAFAAIASSDVILAMRLHALVSGIFHGVPSVALSYDPKVSSLAARFGLEDAIINLSAIDAASTAAAIQNALARSGSFSDRVAPALRDARGGALRNRDMALDLLRHAAIPDNGLNPNLRDLLSRSVRNYLVSARDLHQQINILSYQLSLKQQEAEAAAGDLNAARRQLAAATSECEALRIQQDSQRIGSDELRRERDSLLARLDASHEETDRVAAALDRQRLLTEREIGRLTAGIEAAAGIERSIRDERDEARRAHNEDKERHLAQLLDVSRRAAETELRFESYRADKEPWIAALNARIASMEREFTGYRAEKESHIASLHSRLAHPFLHLLASIFGGAGRTLAHAVSRLIPPALRRFSRLYGTELVSLHPQSPAEVYSGKSLPLRGWTKPISLISTVFNEERGLAAWLESIERQTRQPDEIVIVDAGSSDSTVALIEEFARKQSYPVRVLVSPGANISAGRNLAIREAAHELIACTDAGCLLDDKWLENLTLPFEEGEREGAVDVVAGWTESAPVSGFPRLVSELFIPRRSSVQFESYLPSSRTIAFSRAAWRTVGGYPEWLTRWAEDTWFAIHLRNRCRRWVVQPAAVVRWGVRDSWKATAQQAWRYGFGDGEAGIGGPRYVHDVRLLVRAFVMATGAIFAAGLIARFSPPMWRAASLIAFVALFGILFISRARAADFVYGGTGKGILRPLSKTVLLYTVLLARTIGYARGLRARPAAAQRRLGALEGCAVIFSGVPIDDSGGGQRAAQLALELLERRFRVIFLNQYPRQESANLGMRVDHPDLETGYAPDFDAHAFLATLPAGMKVFAIAEFPHPAFLENLRVLHAGGVPVIYDLIDNWRSSLGGDWYSIAVEEEYLGISDHLIASARPLAKWLEGLGAGDVTYVPNAVNTGLFAPRSGKRPADMPAGAYTIIYVGALWGSWFDWDLLTAVARTHHTASVVVIGDYRGECRTSLPNLHFLGLKSQTDLPDYLTHADVAIVPFMPSQLVDAVSPLKVFEYIAMGLPVVATRIPEIKDLPYVLIADTATAFTTAIESARHIAIDPLIIARFRKDHCWTARVDRILEISFGGEGVRYRTVGAHQ